MTNIEKRLSELKRDHLDGDNMVLADVDMIKTYLSVKSTSPERELTPDDKPKPPERKSTPDDIDWNSFP